jgi:hypothetical protein
MGKKSEMKSIFVFGSNEAGRHGKGAALFAKKNHGAVYGQGWGLQGTSFAIPTKDAYLKVLPLDKIGAYVKAFLDFARSNPDMLFQLTPIGTGLSGYDKEDILRILYHNEVPVNVVLTREWIRNYS